MSNEAKLQKEAMHVLKLTSRTFYIPIKLLNPTLRKTVGSAYLCMRAIDEIEDHEGITIRNQATSYCVRQANYYKQNLMMLPINNS